eukprot:564030-Prymnesium_polylepis.1
MAVGVAFGAVGSSPGASLGKAITLALGSAPPHPHPSPLTLATAHPGHRSPLTLATPHPGHMDMDMGMLCLRAPPSPHPTVVTEQTTAHARPCTSHPPLLQRSSPQPSHRPTLSHAPQPSLAW